jgi:hypothetical protein
LSVDEIEKGKKIAKYILGAELISIILLVIFKLNKRGFDYKDIIFTVAVITLFVGHYRGNKIISYFMSWWIFALLALISIVLFIKTDYYIGLNIYISWIIIISTIGISFAMRKFIRYNKLDDYHEKFIMYKHNKKSKKIKNIENIIMIISLLVIKC